MVGNMNDLPILDHSTNPSSGAMYTFPSIGLADGNTTLKSDQVGHFHIRNGIGGPYILARLLTGTAKLQIQIMDKNNETVGDIPNDGTRNYMMRNTLYLTEYSNAFYSWNWAGQYVSKDASLTTNNNNEQAKILKSGEYRLKLRGLRVFGNIDKKKDWDEWISPKLMLNIE
jgi:hypothetical protein